MGGTDVTMPEQKSYGESLRDAMEAQIKLGPEYYEAEAEYRPKYAQLETGILGQTLLGEGGMEEFQQRGLLDLMGAPAQRYATGGVAPQTGADPMAAQFEQGFTGQAPLETMAQPQSIARTAAQPFIGEGQDQRVRRPAQRGQMP